MERHALSIKFDSSDGSRPAEWTVSGLSLVALAAAAFAILVALGFVVTRVGDLASRAGLAERLALRNAELEEGVLRINALEQELATLREFDREIRYWAGLPENAGDAPRNDGAATDLEGPAGAPPSGADLAAQNLRIGPARLAGAAAGLNAEDIGRAHPLIWPVDGWVSSEFAEDRGAEGPHTGLDLVAPRGAPVVAAGAGRIVAAGYDAQYGRAAVIDHGGGLVTLYGHNAEVAVRLGEAVARGQRIASVGSTGRSTAPHLHFEVRYDGYALDPRPFLSGAPRAAGGHGAADHATEDQTEGQRESTN